MPKDTACRDSPDERRVQDMAESGFVSVDISKISKFESDSAEAIMAYSARSKAGSSRSMLSFWENGKEKERMPIGRRQTIFWRISAASRMCWTA